MLLHPFSPSPPAPAWCPSSWPLSPCSAVDMPPAVLPPFHLSFPYPLVDGMMIDPAAHPQHRNNLKHLVHVWSRCGKFAMWVWSLNHCTMLLFVAQLQPRISLLPSKSGPTKLVVMTWWWIHLPIHGIWMFPNTLYMIAVNEETIPCGTGASTIAPCHCLQLSCNPGFQPTTKTRVNSTGYNGMIIENLPIHSI